MALATRIYLSWLAQNTSKNHHGKCKNAQSLLLDSLYKIAKQYVSWPIFYTQSSNLIGIIFCTIVVHDQNMCHEFYPTSDLQGQGQGTHIAKLSVGSELPTLNNPLNMDSDNTSHSCQ